MTVFRELVLNAALLLSIVLILDLRDHWPAGALKRGGRHVQSLIIGLAVGAVALMILWGGVQPEPGVRVDTRSVLFVISGLFLGTVPTLVAAVIAAAGRIFLAGGVATATGVAVIVTSACIGLLWRRKRRNQLDAIPWYEFLVLGIVVQIFLLVDIAVFAGEASGRLLRTTAWPTSLILPLLTMALGIVAAGRVKRAKVFTQARLEAAALNAAADATIILTADGTIEWVNPAFTTLTGYSWDEAVGRNPREILKSGEQSDAFYADMWSTLVAGNVWKGELVNRRKDGSHYTEEQTITPVKDETGQTTHFIAIKRDISAGPNSRCSIAKPKRWKASDGSRAALPTTSTTCSPSSTARWSSPCPRPRTTPRSAMI